jgi:hypothetical protein
MSNVSPSAAVAELAYPVTVPYVGPPYGENIHAPLNKTPTCAPCDANDLVSASPAASVSNFGYAGTENVFVPECVAEFGLLPTASSRA